MGTGNPGYQITLVVAGRPCLVIGGGGNAEERTRRLLDGGAEVTVVSPDLTPGLSQMASEGRVLHHPRKFADEDLRGVFLVMNTVLSDPGLSLRLFGAAETWGFLLNCHDQPKASNFQMPALVRQGFLRVAISTSGEGPGVALKVREGLQRMFDGTFGRYLDRVSEVRRRARMEEPDPERRIARVRAMTEGLRIHGEVQYPETMGADPRGAGVEGDPESGGSH